MNERIDTWREIETPEGVLLRLPVAGLLPRAAAFAIDLLIRASIYTVAAMVLACAGDTALGLLFILFFGLEWFYPVIFEVWRGGATPGKRALGLIVVHDDGTPITAGASVVRNLLRYVDFLPLMWVGGMLSMVLRRDFKRLGDLAAGTIVIHARSLEAQVQRSLPAAAAHAAPPPIPLNHDEQRALLEYAERRDQWSAERGEELAEIVSTAIPGASPDRLSSIARWIAGDHAGPARGMNQSVFRRRGEKDWKRLEAQLEALLPGRPREVDVADLPQQTRRLSQQLALAQHRGYTPTLVHQLNQLATRAHHSLYARASDPWSSFADMLLVRFPAALRAEWRLVVVAHLLFYVPFLGLYALGLAEPTVLNQILDAETQRSMLDMYDPSSPHLLHPRGEDSDVMMFGYYIRNNIGIAFQTYAGGLLAGLGTLFYLGYNGLFLGACAALVDNAGFGTTFWPFVVGHGAFELTAIVLAGVAGLKLGVAALAPGQRSRTASITQAGKDSLPLVAGFSTMLIIAAFLEAFWSSAHAVPPEARLAVGAVLWAAVYGLLYAGARRAA